MLTIVSDWPFLTQCSFKSNTLCFILISNKIDVLKFDAIDHLFIPWQNHSSF